MGSTRCTAALWRTKVMWAYTPELALRLRAICRACGRPICQSGARYISALVPPTPLLGAASTRANTTLKLRAPVCVPPKLRCVTSSRRPNPRTAFSRPAGHRPLSLPRDTKHHGALCLWGCSWPLDVALLRKRASDQIRCDKFARKRAIRIGHRAPRPSRVAYSTRECVLANVDQLL